MAKRGGHANDPQFDLRRLLTEAQHRWLRPAEICEILTNYHKFQISTDPPNKPPSGSVYLFNRKVLRYFRRDGHKWKKKNDGVIVREAHEKLKVGSVEVLHCYYAHGEENVNFRRRSYWMLEKDMMHIVFVHYLEIEPSKTHAGSIRVINTVPLDRQNAPSSSNSNCRTPSGYADHTSVNSSLNSPCEDTDSDDAGDSHQTSPSVQSTFESPQLRNGPQMVNTRIQLLLHLCSNNHDGQSSEPEFPVQTLDFREDSIQPSLQTLANLNEVQLLNSHEVSQTKAQIERISTLSVDEVMETECLKSCKSLLEFLVKADGQTGAQFQTIRHVLEKLTFIESKYHSASGITAKLNKAHSRMSELEEKVVYTSRLSEVQNEDYVYQKRITDKKLIIEDLKKKLATEEESLKDLEASHSTVETKMMELNSKCEQTKLMLPDHCVNEKTWAEKALEARDDLESIQTAWNEIQQLLHFISG